MAKKNFKRPKTTFKAKPKAIKKIDEVVTNDYTTTEAFRINLVFTPPYSIIVDTNFVNFCIKRKLDLKTNFLKCLLSNSKFYVTDCVVSELEKLGRIFRVGLGIVKSDLFTRLRCEHKGTYADDCIVNRCKVNRCYIVATCDTELKNRLKKLQGVPIVCIKGKKFSVEGLPHAPTGL